MVSIINDKTLLLGVFVLLTIASFLGIKLNIIYSHSEAGEKRWGIVYLPVVYLILLLLFFDVSKIIIISSMIVFAFAEPLSTFVESKFSKKYLQITSDHKSILGLITFAVVSFIILAALIYFLVLPRELHIQPDSSFDYFFLAAAFVTAIIISAFVAICSKESDIIIIPVVTSYFLYMFFNNIDWVFLQEFIVGIILAALVAGVSFKVKFLTLSGSIATFLLAGFIFGLGGVQWSIPMLTFFILSSIISKLRKKINEEVELYFEKSGVRDYLQVFANGGLGGVLVIINSIYPKELFYLIYLSTLAAVCADTWATEFGTLRKTVTYNILNFKPTTQGVSGGVSILGTTGAFGGAFVISLSGVYWINFELVHYFILILIAGMIGSFFDSFLGATIQVQHKCNICEKITERSFHCGERTKHFKGLTWINNDLVNLLAGFAGAIALLMLKSLVTT